MSRHKVASAVIAVPLAGVVALFGAAVGTSGNVSPPVAVADAGAASVRPSEPAARSTTDAAAQEAATRAAEQKAAQEAAAARTKAAKQKADREAAAEAKATAAKIKAAKIKAAKAKAAKIKAAKAKAAKAKAARAKAAKQKAAREKAAREAAAREKAAANCTPGYSPCLPPASDYDCAGGSGNGPEYAEGPVRVTGSDPYDLDRDGDGIGCDD